MISFNTPEEKRPFEKVGKGKDGNQLFLLFPKYCSTVLPNLMFRVTLVVYTWFHIKIYLSGNNFRLFKTERICGRQFRI